MVGGRERSDTCGDGVSRHGKEVIYWSKQVQKARAVELQDVSVAKQNPGTRAQLGKELPTYSIAEKRDYYFIHYRNSQERRGS